MSKENPTLDLKIFTPLFAIGETRDVKERTVLFNEGETGDCMYIIEQGKVCILFDKNRQRKELGPGKIFGELVVLTDLNRRTGSAVASTDCRLRVISRETLEQFRKENPETAFGILKEACTYLVESETSLVKQLKLRTGQLEQMLDYLHRTADALDSKELMALTDEMTGFYNRRCFNAQLAKFMDHAKETGPAHPRLALIFIDIDKFKSINDTYGHPAGDDVLCHLAGLIKSRLGKTDFPCRLGGDEFVVILNDTDEPAARSWASKLLQEITSNKVEILGASLDITVSVGGEMLRPEDDPGKLLARADGSLYLAKRGGRNCLAWNGTKELVRGGD